MTAITIGQVKARYRIPRAVIRQQPRVQRIVDDAFTRVLEGSIERHGIGASGYVCVSDVQAVATVRLRETDAALAAGVGDAIAAAIQRLIDERSPLVVQYSSRVHALIDLAVSASAGEWQRSWAWTQMGIWRVDFATRPDVTADLIVRALAKEPTHAVAVVAHLAREWSDRFAALVTRAPAEAWSALARAAIIAAGGADVPAFRPSRGGASRPAAIEVTRHDAQDATPASIVARIVAQSAIARSAYASAASVSGETRRALAALAVLETEPAAVAGADVTSLVAAIERALGDESMPRAGARESRDIDPGTRDVHSTVETIAPCTGDAGATAASDDGDLPAGGDQHVPQAARSAERTDVSAMRDAGAALEPLRMLDGESTARQTEAERPADDVIPDVRKYARTEHGGLLYLVNLLSRIGTIDSIGRDPHWTDRGLRWVLHQLAIALAGIDADDPAALTFAGLAPSEPPPSSLQDPPTDDERAALDRIRTAIAFALREALPEPAARGDASGDASGEQLLRQICGRAARIVAEPGWIEAHFSADDVSLDVRRAGLDRNPDWVPWLGIVLRFIYA